MVYWATKKYLDGDIIRLAGLLEKQVKFPQEIGFSEDEISFNTLPRKVLKWNEINNALIKDGLITIDQKNNKLFQREIEGYVSADIEKEFNAFCYHCINFKKERLSGSKYSFINSTIGHFTLITSISCYLNNQNSRYSSIFGSKTKARF